MWDELLERLHSANSRLTAVLADLELGANKPAITLAEELQCVLSSLAQVRDLPKHDLDLAVTDERISGQVALYRSQLTRLQQLLPSIQIRLLTERARLEKERVHLTSAGAWAEINRETLLKR